MTNQYQYQNQSQGPITQWFAETPDKITRVECLKVADDYVLRRYVDVSAKVSFPRESAEHRYCDTWQEAKEFLRKLAIEDWTKALAEERRTAELCTVITRMAIPDDAND